MQGYDRRSPSLTHVLPFPIPILLFFERDFVVPFDIFGKPLGPLQVIVSVLQGLLAALSGQGL